MTRRSIGWGMAAALALAVPAGAQETQAEREAAAALASLPYLQLQRLGLVVQGFARRNRGN